MTLDAQLTDIAAQVAALTANAAATAAALTSVTAERDAAVAMIDVKAAHASDLESQLSATQAERDAAAGQVRDLTAERDTLSARLSALAPPTGSVLSAADFLKRIAPAFLRIDSLDAPKPTKWNRIVTVLIPSFAEINLTDPLVQGMVADALADGLFGDPTSAEAKATAAAVLTVG